MARISFVLFFLTALANAQIVTIPDANFKSALLGHNPVIDTNSDGEIQVSEAEVLTTMFVQNKNINSLVGIESFINLQNLNCSINNLTELNISALSSLTNLRCDSNMLNSLDLSQNTLLTDLACNNNNLSVVDVTNNPNLEALFCDSNPINSLDITQNPNLSGLWCTNTAITGLDTSQNPVLLGVYINDNQLTHLDFRQNPILDLVWCYNNNLEFLDVRTGNNSNMFAMLADGNPNLLCIAVDDVDFSNSQACGFPSGWCKDDTAVYHENCGLTVNDYATNKVVVFPNPVTETLYIGSGTTYDKIQVYSVQGYLLLESHETKIDVTSLTSGVYFVKAFGNNHPSTGQFVKN